jgi:hypothetical protein
VQPLRIEFPNNSFKRTITKAHHAILISRSLRETRPTLGTQGGPTFFNIHTSQPSLTQQQKEQRSKSILSPFPSVPKTTPRALFHLC